ncbi:uncharacterized protein LOC129223285 [Uloborus diversus]|uniref:uncharacterized protein LOC129223285 n=1 Tax=Uloborus diversus TaxID=327109 RepID=UPI00240932AE|nr:uncharacterized protein LOC129223285 [Uloborus diversus]
MPPEEAVSWLESDPSRARRVLGGRRGRASGEWPTMVDPVAPGGGDRGALRFVGRRHRVSSSGASNETPDFAPCCDGGAHGGSGSCFGRLGEFGSCPVDPSVAERVFVDDQSRTTGDYYLYIPFRVFRFPDGARVHFRCNVILCQQDCPWANCGEYMGRSYGRKRRSASPPPSDGRMLTVTNEVTVVDDDHRFPRAAGTGTVEEEIIGSVATPDPHGTSRNNFLFPREYLIGGVALVLSLFVSICVNVYLLLYIRRRIISMDRSDTESVRAPPSPKLEPPQYFSVYDRYSPRTEWKYESREILYPPMPIRHARTSRRSHSFRY